MTSHSNTPGGAIKQEGNQKYKMSCDTIWKCNSKEILKTVPRSWDSVIPIQDFSKTLSAFIVFFLSVGVFCNSIFGQFVFDDTEAVLNNQDVRPDTPVLNLLNNDFWGTRLTHNKSHKSYRPVVVLTYRMNYWFAGGFDPSMFHLTNIILHAINSALSVPALNFLFGGNAPRMSFLAAALFAVHPIHVEAVAGIVGRADLLGGLFSLLSLLAYACAAENKNASTLTKLCLMSSAMVLCGLALFSKEQGITILGICSAYDILVVHKCNPVRAVRNKITEFFKWLGVDYKGNNESTHFINLNTSQTQTRNSISISIIIRHGALLTTGICLLLIRWHVMGSTIPTFQSVDNPASFAEDFWTRVLSYNYLYSLNTWLMLCPEWLCFDWSMGCVPLVTDFHDSRILFVSLFWFAIITFIWRGLTSSDSFSSALNMGLVVTILPFLPASNLFFRVGFVLAERVLYIPSLGFCMLIVLGMHKLGAYKPQFRQVVLTMYCGLLLIFCVRCIHRSGQWIDERTLFRSGLTVCPQNAKIHYNVAKNAGDLGDQNLAVKEYKTALDLHPQYEQAMNNLANILRDQGFLDEAERLLRQALSIRPDFAAAWMNLGIVLDAKKNKKEAEHCYIMALQHRPNYPDCYYNLGNLYLDKNMHAEAYKAWRNATRLRPTFSIAWHNMVIMLESIGNSREAEKVALEGLAILPADAGLHFNLGNTLGKIGRLGEAEDHFLKAIELDPNNAVYHSNLGVLYHRWKKYDLAKGEYNAALALNPRLKSAHSNLRMLNENVNKEKEV